MANCGYCKSRKGKRACPALGAICSQCCGEHRLVRIECPKDCRYLGGLAVVAGADPGASFTKAEYGAAVSRLFDYMRGPAGDEISEQALTLCLLDPEALEAFEEGDEIHDPEPPEEWQTPLLLGFTAYGYRDEQGQRLIDRFLAARSRSLPRGEAAALVALQRARASLFEIDDVRRGAGLRLRDLLSGQTVEVREMSLTESVGKRDLVFDWLLPVGDRLELSGALLPVPRELLEPVLRTMKNALKDLRKARPDVPEGELVGEVAWVPLQIVRQAMSDFEPPELVNTDREQLLWSEARYEIEEPARVRERLASIPGLEPDEEGGFDWVSEERRDGGRVRLGTLRLKDRQLTLEVNSRERLERGRALVESALGSLARHRADSFADVRSRLDDAREAGEGATGRGGGIPEEVEREVVGRYLAEHYQRWVDEPLPALAGKTPREAVKTRSGKKKVEELIKGAENLAARQVGGDAIDFRRMRSDLGLPVDAIDLRYDASSEPGPSWLEADEQMRIGAVEDHHAGLAGHPELARPLLHAAMHVIVENQIAMGDPPETAAAVRRLVAEGATRHEAIHAVGSVLSEEMNRMLAEQSPYDREATARRLGRLNARDCRGSSG